jgi:predicted Zn-dependent protease
MDSSRRNFMCQTVNCIIAGTGLCRSKANAGGINGLPDLGDSDRANLSAANADLLSRQVIIDINAQGKMLNDYDSLDYLNNLGSSLVSYSPLAGQPFNFYLLKDLEINAFALPGGYICVNNGLIYATMSEAELSSVLSHEIGHVVQHHIFRNLSVANRAQWTAIAGLIAGALLAPLNPGIAMLATQSGQGLAIQNMLTFSRDYEREADRVGQQILGQAGFDPHAMPMFFKRMSASEQFNSNAALAFLQTHPVTVERMSDAEDRANQMPASLLRADSIDFLLVREKCRVRQLALDDGLKFYRDSIAQRRYVSLDAQYYGLALNQFLNKQVRNSSRSLNLISNPEFQHHPIIIGLKAQQFIARGNYKVAALLYQEALVNYPNHKGLWMGQLEFLIASKEYSKAEAGVEQLTQTHATDANLWEQYAILYSDAKLNNPLRYHYGLANLWYFRGDYKRAVEHYRQALQPKFKNGSKDSQIQERISSLLPRIIQLSEAVG